MSSIEQRASKARRRAATSQRTSSLTLPVKYIPPQTLCYRAYAADLASSDKTKVTAAGFSVAAISIVFARFLMHAESKTKQSADPCRAATTTMKGNFVIIFKEDASFEQLFKAHQIVLQNDGVIHRLSTNIKDLWIEACVEEFVVRDFVHDNQSLITLAQSKKDN